MSEINGSKRTLAEQIWLTVLARMMIVFGVPVLGFLGLLAYNSITGLYAEQHAESQALAQDTQTLALHTQILSDLTQSVKDGKAADDSALARIRHVLAAIFDNVGTLDAKMGMKPPPVSDQ